MHGNCCGWKEMRAALGVYRRREFWWKFEKLNVMCGLTLRQTEWGHYTNTHLRETRTQTSTEAQKRTCCFLHSSISPSSSLSSLHPPSLHMCETCCRGNGLQRCVFIRGGEASVSPSLLLPAFWNRIKPVGEENVRVKEMEINHLSSPCSPFHLFSYVPQCFNFLFVSGHDPLQSLALW